MAIIAASIPILRAFVFDFWSPSRGEESTTEMLTFR